MPYVSDAQRKYFNANAGKKKGLTTEIVREWNSASKGQRVPAKKKKK
jgi:hypothetical protein